MGRPKFLKGLLEGAAGIGEGISAVMDSSPRLGRVALSPDAEAHTRDVQKVAEDTRRAREGFDVEGEIASLVIEAARRSLETEEELEG